MIGHSGNSAVKAPLNTWMGLTFPLSTRVQGDPDLHREIRRCLSVFMHLSVQLRQI